MFKKLAIIFVAVFGVLLAVPTMAPSLAPYFPSWIQPIPLGLDLKGGAQLLLEVDTNTMMQEKAAQLYEEARAALIDRDKGVIRFSNMRNIDGVVSFVVREEDDVSRARGRYAVNLVKALIFLWMVEIFLCLIPRLRVTKWFKMLCHAA